MGTYPFPWRLFLQLGRDLPRGRRSLAADCRFMVDRITPSPLVTGLDHIPARGPLLVVANHYQRRGLWIAWPGALVTLAVWERRDQQRDMHWLVTGGLRLLQSWNRGPELPCSGSLFHSVARTYGMTALPLTGPGRRVRALREWLGHARRGGVIGLFPEGTRGSAQGLVHPDPGLDTVSRALQLTEASILPVGIFEFAERLHVKFGTPIRAQTGVGEECIMMAIASLLPVDLRGEYANFLLSERET